MPSLSPNEGALVGLLLGTAVGDALGLPAENLSPARIRQRWKAPWRMRFLLGRGMISDDTEHTLLVAQTLLSHPRDSAAFMRALAWKLRWWFAALPGGVGLATARACLKLWTGVPPHRAGVRSAGSGPAMRSAVLGAYFADAPESRREFVLASSRLTHRGWQAEVAALAVAECAALAGHPPPSREDSRVIGMLQALSNEAEWRTVCERMACRLAAGDSVAEFACALGLERGVSGCSLHVVPVAIYAWRRHPGDFRGAMEAALDCGGDTDTVGAILGGIMGATVGERGIPADWIGALWEWPRSVRFMRQVAAKLAAQVGSDTGCGPVPFFWPGLLPRNALFLATVLAHGFRRLAPPY